jgi:LAO/AO transport system kinase
MSETRITEVGELTPAQQTLLADFRAGKRPALARLISLVENNRPGFQALLHSLHGQVGRAHRIGVTGPPGAGKSTLTSALISRYRARGETVGVVAVDPTSPFTGGALLGDRIRMAEMSTDPGVFIRSMATRGSLGGLAITTNEVADVLDAFGFDRLLIETVGVGQSELDIAGAADSTVVLLVPESGDSVQAMKAGLMEISDLFVVNKADRPGAERLALELELMLHLRAGQAMRNVPAHHGVSFKSASGSGPPSGSGDHAVTGRNPRSHAVTPQPSDRAAARGLSGTDSGAGSETESDAGADGGAGVAAATWEIPVLRTTAETGDGVDELLVALDRHAAWLEATAERSRRRRDRLATRVREAVARGVMQVAWLERGGRDILQESLPALEAGTLTPYQVAARIVRAAAG